MKRNLARRVVIFGSMLTAAVTVAQAAAANPLTVSEAVSEALKNNPELYGLAADVAATKGEIVTARTFSDLVLYSAVAAALVAGVLIGVAVVVAVMWCDQRCRKPKARPFRKP